MKVEIQGGLFSASGFHEIVLLAPADEGVRVGMEGG